MLCHSNACGLDVLTFIKRSPKLRSEPVSFLFLVCFSGNCEILKINLEPALKHEIGLGSKKWRNFDTLENIVKDLGHVDRKIEVLKIDCEVT